MTYYWDNEKPFAFEKWESLGKDISLPPHSSHALAFSCSEYVRDWKVSDHFPNLVQYTLSNRIGGPGVQSGSAFSVLLKKLGYALFCNCD